MLHSVWNAPYKSLVGLLLFVSERTQSEPRWNCLIIKQADPLLSFISLLCSHSSWRILCLSFFFRFSAFSVLLVTVLRASKSGKCCCRVSAVILTPLKMLEAALDPAMDLALYNIQVSKFKNLSWFNSF